MSNLDDYTREELQEEIDKRDGTEKPTFVKEPNLDYLKESMQSYVDYVWSDEYHEDNDYSDYIHEAAMLAFYGESIFEIINKKRP